MRSRCVGPFAVVLLAAMILAGCQSQGALSSDASLKSISVAGVPATLGTPSSNWKEATAGSVTISNSMSIAAAIGVEKSDGGAIVYYAAAEGMAQPSFVDSPNLTVANDNFLYLEVFSANQDAVSFYKVKVAVVDDTPLLFDIFVGGRSAAGYAPTPAPVQQFGLGLGTPAATYDAAVAGEVWFGKSQAGSAVAVSATPMIPTKTALRYAVASGTAAPVFSDTATAAVADGSFLYVESSLGGSSPAVLIYKLKLVQKGDDRSLSSVTINGQPMPIGAMGTHSFPGEENMGSYTKGAQLATTGNKGIYSVTDASGLASITIAATPTDPNLAVLYDVASVDRGIKDYLVFRHGPRTDNATGVFSSLAHGQYLAIQVTSEIGEKGWYAFRIAIGQSGADITSATVGGVPATSLGSPFTAGAYGISGRTPGAVTIPTPTGNTTVAAALDTYSDQATVEYAVTSLSMSFYGNLYLATPAAAAWNTTGVFPAGTITATNKYILVKVTSKNLLYSYVFAIEATLQ